MADKFIKLAHVLDMLRIFPRLFIGMYIYLLYQSVMWFMGLHDPTVAQAGLISVITGVGAAWFSSYVSSGPKLADLNKKPEEK